MFDPTVTNPGHAVNTPAPGPAALRGLTSRSAPFP